MGMALGATDVILDDENDRLLMVVRRELANLDERRRRRAAEIARDEAEQRLAQVLETASAAIAYIHEGMHVHANHAYLELFGFASEDDLAGVPLLDLIAPDSQQEVRARMRAFSENDADDEPFAVTGVRSDGEQEVPARMALAAAEYDGEPCLQVLLQPDTREASGELAAQIEQARNEDPLTGLLTRPAFLQGLERMVAAARQDSASGGLFNIQLDAFESLGAKAGASSVDVLIGELAEVLRGSVPEGTILGRIADDVFAAVVPNVSRGEVTELGERLRAAIAGHRSDTPDGPLETSASVGITMLGTRTDSADEAIGQASRATSRVREKDKAGDGVYLFDPEDFVTRRTASEPSAEDETNRARLELLSDAMRNNTLVLLYQPIVSLRGDSSELYEVYLRLPDGDGRMLRPEDFVDLAEQAGMGGRVDRWVVLHAIKKLAQHRGQGHDTRITINLTHAALTDDSFLPWLRVALKAAKLPREAVILQFTELAATRFLSQAKAFTEALAKLECMASLSHFGGAVNPFGTLDQLNVSYVKLDGSFVDGLDREFKREELRETIAALKEREKLTIVPKVETASTMATLFQSGASFVQGDYLQEPGTEMEFEFGTDM